MLLDGYWKKELNAISKRLNWLSKHPYFFNQSCIEHKINKELIYSTIIMRKIWEDDKIFVERIKKISSKKIDTEILNYQVPIAKYNHIDDEKLFSYGMFLICDYDAKNCEFIHLPLNQVCNQIIHSYVWSIIHNSAKKQIYGAIFASDNYKETGAYLLKIDDWIETINFVVSKCCI